jgi:hypothetical protein
VPRSVLPRRNVVRQAPGVGRRLNRPRILSGVRVHDQRGHVRAPSPRRPGQSDHAQRRRLEREGEKQRTCISHCQDSRPSRHPCQQPTSPDFVFSRRFCNAGFDCRPRVFRAAWTASLGVYMAEAKGILMNNIDISRLPGITPA